MHHDFYWFKEDKLNLVFELKSFLCGKDRLRFSRSLIILLLKPTSEKLTTCPKAFIAFIRLSLMFENLKRSKLIKTMS